MDHLRLLSCLVVIISFIVTSGCDRCLEPRESPKGYVPPVIVESVALPVRDADGIALGDLTGNGKIDILTSEGKHGTVIWFEQGNHWREWKKHHIYTIGRERKEIEGNALGDLVSDGRLEALSLDQPNGDIYLHKHSGNPRGHWETAIIRSGRPLLQDVMINDVDGDGRQDIVYTWQGRNAGEGGVHWLKLTGDNPLDAAHWTDYVMATHESAWWLVPKRLDLSGNGEATDIVFTARDTERRNPASKPGLFWLEPNTDVSRPWKKHTIDTLLPHPKQVDAGDLSGRGHGKDLVVATISESIYWYEFSKNWKRHEITMPVIGGSRPNRIWNVTIMRLGGQREGIIAPVLNRSDRRGALLFFEFLDGRFEPTVLRNIDYGHPMDDRMVLHDVTGDGQAEIFVPDSGISVDLLHIIRLGRNNRKNF